MYMCLEWVIIGSGNGMLHVRHPASTETSADVLSIDQLHKSQNAPISYPTMLHVHISVQNEAFWDMAQVDSGIVNYVTFQWCWKQTMISIQENAFENVIFQNMMPVAFFWDPQNDVIFHFCCNSVSKFGPWWSV